MYEIDPKFFNDDGSINTDKACRAGRKAQARTAREGAAIFKTAAKKVIAVTAGLFDAKATERHS